MPTIEHSAAPGALTYLIHAPPASLPSVRKHDLAEAWELAREAAIREAPGPARALRFAPPGGEITDLALADRDARCWAGAVDQRHGMATAYGLSLCLRLLALVDLLAAPWARPLYALKRQGAVLDASLLRLAAEAKLTEEARFDEGAFRAALSPRLGPAP